MQLSKSTILREQKDCYFRKFIEGSGPLCCLAASTVFAKFPAAICWPDVILYVLNKFVNGNLLGSGENIFYVFIHGFK